MTPKYITHWQCFEAWTQEQHPEKKDRYLVKNHFHYSAFTKNGQVMSPSVHLTFESNSFHLFLLLISQISIATAQKENTALDGIRVLGENNSTLFHPQKKNVLPALSYTHKIVGRQFFVGLTFLHILQEEHWLLFYCRLHFQGCLYHEQAWEKKNILEILAYLPSSKTKIQSKYRKAYCPL